MTRAHGSRVNHYIPPEVDQQLYTFETKEKVIPTAQISPATGFHDFTSTDYRPVRKRPEWPEYQFDADKNRKSDIPGDCVRISSGIEIHILESLRNQASRLRIVIIGKGLNVDIVGTIDIEFNRYISWKNEIRV